MGDALASYAARFDAPFWTTKFKVDGDTRSVTVNGTKITEVLDDAGEMGYSYSASGVDGIGAYRGSFEVTDDGTATMLAWRTSFEARDVAAAANMSSINAGGAQAMLASLAAHFAPAPLTP